MTEQAPVLHDLDNTKYGHRGGTSTYAAPADPQINHYIREPVLPPLLALALRLSIAPRLKNCNKRYLLSADLSVDRSVVSRMYLDELRGGRGKREEKKQEKKTPDQN